jgi:hypothetical protein
VLYLHLDTIIKKEQTLGTILTEEKQPKQLFWWLNWVEYHYPQ